MLIGGATVIPLMGTHHTRPRGKRVRPKVLDQILIRKQHDRVECGCVVVKTTIIAVEQKRTLSGGSENGTPHQAGRDPLVEAAGGVRRAIRQWWRAARHKLNEELWPRCTTSARPTTLPRGRRNSSVHSRKTARSTKKGEDPQDAPKAEGAF